MKELPEIASMQSTTRWIRLSSCQMSEGVWRSAIIRPEAASGHRLEPYTHMSEQNEMDKTPGKISWKELMTRDAEASAG